MTGDGPDRVPVREDLADLEPYGAPQLDVPVRLNVNETAEPPPAAYLQRVAAEVPGFGLNRYPDREATALRTALGTPLGLPAANVWAANGSNEVLAQLFQAYGGPGRTMLTTRPGYSMYPDLARVSGTTFAVMDLDEDFRLTTAVVDDALATYDPTLVIIASPNNPTGIVVDHDVVRHLHDTSRALVVIDEAYVEFGPTSVVDLLAELSRLVVVRTFSKAYRMAGLRFGYLFGPDWVVHDLRRVRLPYHLDEFTQTAARIAAEDPASFLDHRSQVASERSRVAASLTDMRLEHWTSEANFILFRVPEATRVFDAMLAQGVLVRDFSSRPRLEGCLRVTIGTPAENDAFVDALMDALA